MNTITIQNMKEKADSVLRVWIEERINDLVGSSPKLAMASVYMKRGANNWLSREAHKIDELINNASLFVCDENGNINMETLFSDMLSVFKNMDEVSFEYGVLKGNIGKGVIRILLPENPFISFLFGETGALKITDADLMELKALFADETLIM